jgi:CubicO group peptidase (beta-lactamase class C family)
MSTRRDFVRHTMGLAVLPVALNRAAEPPAAGETGAPLDGGNARFTRSLENARAAGGVTGASFAYWDGKMLHTAVAGLRNSVTQDPVTTDTVMHVGSITKVMNAALVMQLVDEGKIALEDPVLKHLPDLRTRDMEALRRVSCAMLLNHTSGINCEWLREYGPDQERIEDSIARCAGVGQLFAPGEETSYCNMGSVIAGYLVQKARGQSWYTLMKTHLYEPLGLQHALVDVLEVPRFRASVGDLTDAATGKLVQTTRPFLAPSFAPAGSTQMMTAGDLVTFGRALLDGGVGSNGTRILSAASALRMTRPTAQFVPIGNEVTKVGLGWMIVPGGVLNHGGGGPGVSSQIYADPKSGRVAALLTNCDRGDALHARFLEPIVRSWTGLKPVPLQRQPGPVDAKPYAGTYESNADRYVIVPHEGALAMRTQDLIDTYDNSAGEGGPLTALYPVGNDTFQGDPDSRGGSGRIVRFVRPDAQGKMRFLASWDRLLARVS